MFKKEFLSMTVHFREPMLCAFLSWVIGMAGQAAPVLAADFCRGDDACGFGRVCADNKCVDAADCVVRYKKECVDNDVYWVDSCGNQGGQFVDCGSDTYTSEYQCSGSMVQQKVVARGCDAGECKEVTGWIDIQNCADKGNVCKGGACRADAVTPPVLYYLEPSGKVYTSSVTLSFTTNKAAECRYGYYDVSFAQMTAKFFTSDSIHHSVAATLNTAGAYNFYVRCRDTAGNANLVSSKIAFEYVISAKTQTAPGTPKTQADINPPVISNVLPAGTVDLARVQFSLMTNEKAACRFDISDTGYDSMDNELTADASGMAHRRSVRLSATGGYTYYVRCKDAAGNMNKTSAVIGFNYVPATGPSDAAISDTRPFGTVYQNGIALELTTSEPSICLYSANEADFDSAGQAFTTENGRQHIALVTLGDYGGYRYYVRCKDNSDPTKVASSEINFRFNDPNQSAPATKPEECAQVARGTGNGVCDTNADCVCDPDCKAAAGPIDPDCPAEPGTDAPSDRWLAAGVIVLVLVAAAYAVMARHRGDANGQFEEDGDDFGF